jgi:coatomer protein complex subunit gamma
MPLEVCRTIADIDRCLDDVDDEVRDRAAMYIKVLEEKSLADVFVREGESHSNHG